MQTSVTGLHQGRAHITDCMAKMHADGRLTHFKGTCVGAKITFVLLIADARADAVIARCTDASVCPHQ